MSVSVLFSPSPICKQLVGCQLDDRTAGDSHSQRTICVLLVVVVVVVVRSTLLLTMRSFGVAITPHDVVAVAAVGTAVEPEVAGAAPVH